MKSPANSSDSSASKSPAEEIWRRVLFEESFQPAWIFDSATLAFLDANPAAVARFGYSRDQFLSMTLKDIRPAEDVPALLDRLANFETGREISGEWRHLRSDGTVVYAEVASYDIVFNGRPARLAVINDVTERHLAEERLKKTITEYRGLFENAHDAILIISAVDQTVLDVNQRACEIYGYLRGEFLGMNISELFIDPISGREHLARTIARGVLYHFETVQRRKDESEMFLEINASAITYKDQQAIISINRDVTLRKHAEELLRNEMQRRRLHVQRTPLGVVDWDLQFRVRAWNPAAEKIFGYSDEEMIGKPAEILIPPEARVHVERVWSELMAASGGLSSTNTNLTKDGRTILCDWYNTPLIDANGQVVGVASLVQDVTESRTTRRLLEQSEQRYRTLADTVPAIVFSTEVGATNNDSNTDYYNQRWFDYTGLTFEQSKGSGWAQAVHPDDMSGLIAEWDRCREAGSTCEVEFRLRGKDGTYRWFLVRSVPLRDESGQIIRWLGTSTDITARKAAEAQLSDLVRQRTERIGELERQHTEGEKLIATGRMAARVAHEINNPLAGIAAAFEVLKQSIPTGDRYASFVASIDKEIERIGRITRQMYELYRPETEPPRQFNLDTLVREVIALLNPEAQKRDVKIEFSPDPKLPVTLPEQAVRQMLLNVIRNAIEASPSEETVSIALISDGTTANIAVTDRGGGIDPSIRGEIFEPFVTTKNTTPSAGLGLGLSIAKSLALAMGGGIEFDSAQSRGTTFRIALPIVLSKEGK